MKRYGRLPSIAALATRKREGADVVFLYSRMVVGEFGELRAEFPIKWKTYAVGTFFFFPGLGQPGVGAWYSSRLFNGADKPPVLVGNGDCVSATYWLEYAPPPTPGGDYEHFKELKPGRFAYNCPEPPLPPRVDFKGMVGGLNA